MGDSWKVHVKAATCPDTGIQIHRWDCSSAAGSAAHTVALHFTLQMQHVQCLVSNSLIVAHPLSDSLAQVKVIVNLFSITVVSLVYNPAFQDHLYYETIHLDHLSYQTT